jgi:uncharacterized MnhB-related membrane protein
MRKFWIDLKRTLKLYLIVLAPTLIICSIVAIFDKDVADKTAIACGVLGGLWIVYYEWKHDVWGRKKAE